MEGTSFDPARKAKEDLAKSIALQKELEAQREMDRVGGSVNKKYGLVRTPSPDKESGAPEKKKRDKDGGDVGKEKDKKKKKRKHRDS